MSVVIATQDLTQSLREVPVYRENVVLECPSLEEIIEAIQEKSSIVVTLVSGFQLAIGEEVEEIDQSTMPHYAKTDGREFVFSNCNVRMVVREVELTRIRILSVDEEGSFTFQAHHSYSYSGNYNSVGHSDDLYTITIKRTFGDVAGPGVSGRYECKRG